MIRFLGADGRLLFANKQYERTLGWSLDEIRQQNLDLFALCYPDPDYRRQILDRISRADGQWTDSKTRVRDGRIIDTTFCDIRLSDGTSVGFGMDITERKAAEIELRRLASIVESAEVAIFSKTLDGIILTWNPAAERIYGYAPAEMIGRSVLIITPADRVNEVLGILERLKKGEKAPYFETKRVTKSGQLVDVGLTVSPITDPAGKIIGASAIARDITRRKQIEDKLRQARERAESVLANTSDTYVLFDLNWHFMYVNDAGAKAIARPREQILGRTMWELFPDLVGTELDRRFHFAMEQTVNIVFDFHHLSRDTWWEYRLHPVTEGLAVFGTEITERKRAEAAEREQREIALALRDTAEALATTLDLEQVLDRILENVGRVVPSEAANVILVEAGIGRIVRSRGFEEHGISQTVNGFQFVVADVPNFRRISETGLPDVVVDTQGSPEWIVFPGLEWIRSHVSAPLLIRDEVVGYLSLDSSIPGDFRSEDADKFKAFASQAAVAIENARLYQAGQRKQAEFLRSNSLITALSRVAARLAASLSLEIVLDTLGAELRLFGVDALVALLEPDQKTLAYRYFSIDPVRIAQIEELVGSPLLGVRSQFGRRSHFAEVLAESRPLFISDLSAFLSEWLEGRLDLGERILQLAGAQGEASAIVLPLLAAGQSLGILMLWGGNLQESDVPAVSTFGNQVAVAIKHANLFAQVQSSRQSIQSLSRRLISAQEEERHTIARELHDEIGQALTVLKLSLATFSRTSPDSTKAELASAETLLGELINRVRDMSLNLRPAMLDDFGLLPALLWHIERFSSQTGIRVDLKHWGVEGRRFSAELETAAYRIVQEGLTNVARHAQVSQATVRIEIKKGTLILQISDSGVGLDPQVLAASGAASGLLGMRERAQLLGGKLIVDSSERAGTSINAELPLGIHPERRPRRR